MMKDRLLRPSLVGVSKKVTKKDDTSQKDEQNEDKNQLTGNLQIKKRTLYERKGQKLI